ncbi:UDP-N-acetylmuramoyl-L-alanine--D-glutamate ligase [Sphingomonas sp. CBMAI 2297]|uniref:UDP-N-acetylmuramoyl-L-alanine--D-glutamate ligase n=1 Tax=Sphingomonas sp. CBMAI 2297 TaxID=2991720 RepID=UPI002457BEB9|nr:UDP-N-acetylmuramoyl-L-alanine--D-glutamate ligase [Sphingomonas sp. CBMAI 2297]MDH4744455.1 UDP-N-acetylmuramoyl-L-alanine--D-glutamate ligase [Sphingomonas sp. CBMAI 2297]
MITSTAWRGKRYAVLGLARSGVATVRALMAAGAEVVAWDANEKARDALSPSLRSRGEGRGEGATDGASHVPLSLTLADPVEIDLTGLTAVIVSPGVPLNTHPIATRAAAAGVPVIGDIELFAEARAEMPAHRVIGITGTNGKSTTTALIHHIVDTADIPARLGGNIGLPILGQDPLPEGGVYVLELSSYQIDLTQSLDCDVAVLLNLTPDHLDRYAGFEAYAASKARLFAMQAPGHAAVIGIGDAPSAEIARQIAASGRSEDLVRIAPGACLDQSRWPALQGLHNAQNALAAIAACKALGIAQDAIDKGLETFPGLPHRMERVATRRGVLFVNDSKATNADSAAPALSAYPKIHWILGGKAKAKDLDACRPGFPHVVRAYTIGEAGEMFARLLEGEMPVERSGTLEAAVQSAAARAKEGETVLLSPACASFDQFTDYEARGQAFRDAVEALG